MDPFTLLAVASAAGFVFNKLAGSLDREERREFTFSRDMVASIQPDNKSEFDLSTIDILPEYTLVKGLIDSGFPLIFITGGAGTGKSTFVRWAMKEFEGSVLLGAPTAMSALNIGGKTLHSLCQLPPGWIVKNDIKHLPKRKEIAEAKLLIIDEISMVTSNLLDGVSAFLRVNREVNKPFGGLPVIMVGDMFQLPPVVPQSLQPLFIKHYGSPKFYNARCLQNSTYYAVELKRTYRQSDQSFVNILTRLREGIDVKETVRRLNAGCTITDTPPNGAICLSPRNKTVDEINNTALACLNGTSKIYRGLVSGQFNSTRLPAPKNLILKIGAQILFTRNDRSQRWINGTVGIVKRLLNDKVFVQLFDSGKIVDVGRVEWKEYHYSWNKRERKIDRTEIGSYRQFPLIAGWASTIHKSQGKTIEKIHLDLGKGSFETGQTYVALSRCRSLRGLSMARALTIDDILVDFESKHFYASLREIISNLPPEKLLQQLKPSS
ncbi:ATP-dependent RecD-like DNA helicase [Desulforhopalus sp. IMCC35007]|uniref:ATP-dependent DNA helicase n=1 Tax=Desulforhopalus sp. IMCC35007 TaxID=2569543 RepID=UPI0010AE5648|nr:DEAD/DEAH box helicase [Desulforhopalus sp. IMCC35007]TKB07199.1 DNA topoisomerase I [Desulforhopalus sp. IMCC35007]